MIAAFKKNAALKCGGKKPYENEHIYQNTALDCKDLSVNLARVVHDQLVKLALYLK